MHTLGLKLTNRHNQIKLRKNRISLTTANVFAYFNPKILSGVDHATHFPLSPLWRNESMGRQRLSSFCSERCKLIDLGAWANDEYRLPTQDAPQAENSEE
jgi:endogenous inhibitor of DNA gyrase (YacG/DUF329 family)